MKAMITALAFVAAAAPAGAQSLAGLWDATVVVSAGQDKGTIEVPFRFEISGTGADVKGSFFNGDDKVTSTIGTLENGTLVAQLRRVRHEARRDVEGRPARRAVFARDARRALPVPARRFAPVAGGDAKIPSIAGLWNVQVGKSSKGEAAWQLIVRQSGAEVSAAILRIDGDTGTLTGTFRDGKFVLSHFSGARPLRLELTPDADGTLSVVQNKDNPLTAIARRAGEGQGAAAAERSDALHQREGSDRAVPLQLSRSRRARWSRTPTRASRARS